MMLSILGRALSLPAAIFYILAVARWSAPLAKRSETLALIALASPWLLSGAIAFWVLVDARRRYRHIPYDFGAFVFFTWPVFTPIHLFVTRGWRAFIPLSFFLLFYVVAYFIGAIPYLLYGLRR